MEHGTPYGARRAVNELLAIFDGQWANGMLPQIRFTPGQTGYRPDARDWGVTPAIAGPTGVETSGITQPPIMGLCAAEVWRKLDAASRRLYTPAFLRVVAGLDRYHAWLLRERDPAGEGLVVCLHPWETGTDNSPAFDPLIEATRAFIAAEGLPVETFGRADTLHVRQEHRPTARDYVAYFGLLALFKQHAYDQAAIIARTPFLLQDVLFNSLLVASLTALAGLCESLAEHSAGDAAGLRAAATRDREVAARVAAAIRGKCWDAQRGLFFSYDLRGGRLLRTATVSSLLPLLGGIAERAQAAHLLAHLRDPAAFWTSQPVPSTAASEAVFNPERYWSGPTWPVTNWLVIRGLQERNSPLAEVLRTRTVRLIAEGVDLDVARQAAAAVLAQNSFGEAFTTPSTRQYRHAWLWDSAIVAMSWPLVESPPAAGAGPPATPGFWEYYHPVTGAPLGAAQMSWTASLFLELLALGPG